MKATQIPDVLKSIVSFSLTHSLPTSTSPTGRDSHVYIMGNQRVNIARNRNVKTADNIPKYNSNTRPTNVGQAISLTPFNPRNHSFHYNFLLLRNWKLFVTLELEARSELPWRRSYTSNNKNLPLKQPERTPLRSCSVDSSTWFGSIPYC